MKNSARYASKMKRLLAGGQPQGPGEPADPIRLVVAAVLAEDITARQAVSAMAALEAEFVDFNELRVSPVKDIVECVGRGFFRARGKAEMISRALNGIFEHTNALSLEFLAKKPKREVRQFLRHKLGLSRYAESVVTLYGFEGHAIPVDGLLLESLKLGAKIHPHSDLKDLQGFLERIIPARDDVAAHEALRGHADKAASKVHKRWAREAKAEAKARAEAEAKARAEAQKKAEAEARRKAKAEAKKKAARKKKKAAPAAKKPGKPAARKAVKRKK